MTDTQLQLNSIPRYLLVEKLKQLSNKKRESSKKRRRYKAFGPAEDYTEFFSDSDFKRALLRREIRYLHLANNFLKGTPYKKVEHKVSEGNRLLSTDCAILYSLVEKYIPGVFTREEVAGWVNEY